jgi:hypothetical protein
MSENNRLKRLQRLRERALLAANLKNVNPLREGKIQYDEKIAERMHPTLESQLSNRNTTLGDHPIFPDSDESHFEEKIMSKRFSEVVNNYKRQFDTETADPMESMMKTMQLLGECMELESGNEKELQELAIDMIRKEYDIGVDDVKIIAELTPNISLEGMRQNPSPVAISEMEFDNHDSVQSANAEVYKRRFINAMTQGAAKKGHHMFHLADGELTGMNPTLPSKYAKMMAAADYGYLTNDNSGPKQAGGRVNVEFPSEEGGQPVIHAQAMVFPVLIHELVKGVMEILSAHGLPEDEKLTEYVMGKADFTNAEVGDMQIGPALWERFTQCIDADDFDKKHHIYSELVSLPTEEFNQTMREIMLGSKAGKETIRGIVKEINEDMERDEYEASINEMNSSDDTYGYDDLDDINLEGLF